ncbi:MAG: TetR family transcriptional regulator [Sodaliphilus pleomorphus]|jgi:AcrR family transcriptional regulator|uniref:TetR family transcriptional regulator n=1 Tax=Sodaliphilus pleomorphus TaxID=2606626 RepID=A0A6L5XEB9_9BACT|nr:TetR/AcrR family transcriptional regulator [Sodaliphilus pleomorphus]MDY6253279.1 TetR family transcriptional regulator [Bacteroidales bacterium]MDD6474091.1 TetR family transcriptional regulator [Sodaliphilus pleomorphus]MDD6687845.1 TetR family transcriptional regulator [Sodaliphilus pleomorphus]MDD7065542.1 TetR family transcriptional regulator [Sodaliphilus pleomorphus]MDY2831800.1 TetR family transcriptional regulator [Sodaliphilus pleomorphus]
MVSRTREKLIDVARQLFAHKGVENTTMNDIASASDKGRRTIYTYFKSKTEIFNAVVNREAAIIVDRLAELPDMPLPPEEKLMNFVFMRFEAVKEVVSRNGSLKASFFLDVRRVDRIRRVNAPKEIIILKQILKEGVDAGIFRIKHIDKAAEILLMAMQGLDVHYIRNSFEDIGVSRLKLRTYLQDFIMNGIKDHHEGTPLNNDNRI